MRKLLISFMLFAAVLLLSNAALAYPVLQLDIMNDNASYDPSNETIVTSDPTFNLVALLNPDSGQFKKVSFTTDFTLLASWNTASGSTFTLDGETVTLDSSPAPGNPQLNHGELGSYAYELTFNFNDNNTTTAYDTQDNPGGFAGPVTGGSFVYETFGVDLSGLDPFVPIHFDLYAYTGGNPEKVFAPFSHDASAVPEPASMILLGSGLIGLSFFGRRKFFKKS